MKKLLLIFCFVSLNASSQIHIGEKSREIYTFYKNQSYKANFASYGYAEFLRVWVDGVEMLFYFNEKDVCNSQVLWIRDRDKLYELCDQLKIPLDWNVHTIIYKNKTLKLRTSKDLVDEKLVYAININSIK